MTTFFFMFLVKEEFILPKNLNQSGELMTLGAYNSRNLNASGHKNIF